ncbi:MAG TPA: DUF177 domain-containing protein [Firmicutes bacterium]|nr:DUF177 domain-containing protein [Bacillota bacterium]
MPVEMKIDISRLRGTPGEKMGFSLNEEVDLGWLGVRSGELDFSFPAPLHVWGEVLNTGASYLVQGTLRTVVMGRCVRCLTPFEQGVETVLEEEFREGEPDRAHEASPVAAEAFYFQGDCLDLAEAVRQNLLLALPSQALCRPDCPGLCPVCGKRRAEGPCSCRQEEIDPRLEPLRRFLEKEQEV